MANPRTAPSGSRTPAGPFSRSASSSSTSPNPSTLAPRRRKGGLLGAIKCGTALVTFYVVTFLYFSLLVMLFVTVRENGKTVKRPNTQYPPRARLSVKDNDVADLMTTRLALMLTSRWRH